MKQCPPRFHESYEDGYESTRAGIEFAGPDGAHEIDGWGNRARTRITTETLQPTSFWFLHGVLAAIADHKDGRTCSIAPCTDCVCEVNA